MIWEYFVARHVAYEFDKVLDNRMPEELLELKLSKTALDYVPSTVYGFMADILDSEQKPSNETYQKRLLDWLLAAKEDLKDDWSSGQRKQFWDLMRNVVEYVGKICEDELDVAEQLVALAADEELDKLVRYNAARALERVHPSAPRPYFDFGADWGVKDWSQWRDAPHTEAWGVWAIRGAFLTERIADRIPLLEINFSQAASPALQRHVSERLVDIIRRENDADVLINCSHALVRWCDFRDSGLYRRIAELAAGVQDDRVRENLDRWVRKAAWRFRQIEEGRAVAPNVSRPTSSDPPRDLLGILCDDTPRPNANSSSTEEE
jgi:hypothetical protein